MSACRNCRSYVCAGECYTNADRIAKLEAELADARKAAAGASADWDAERAAHASTRAELEAARAEAAAMRNVIVVQMREGHRECMCCGATAAYNEDDDEMMHDAKCALAGAAGRALGDRIPLWRELERLRREGFTRAHRQQEDDVLEKLAALCRHCGQSKANHDEGIGAARDCTYQASA